MSPLLALAVLLLALVGGLAWWQRRAARDLTQRPSRVGSPPPTPGGTAAARTAATASTVLLDDPVIGPLKYIGDDTWTGEESLALGGHDVVVVILAGPEGPTDEHRAWVKAAIDRFPTIDADARVLLGRALEPHGIASDQLELWQLMVGPHEGGVMEGRLYYDVVHEAVDDLYVRSEETWFVLEPWLNEQRAEGDGLGLADRPDPVLGTISWNGDAGWCNRTPFTLAGRPVQAMYLAGPAGPGPEHHEWLEAAVADGEGLVQRAAALAAETRGWHADAVRLSILTVGPDENGRFIGGLTCHTGGGPCYIFSRDRFATLSPERG